MTQSYNAKGATQFDNLYASLNMSDGARLLETPQRAIYVKAYNGSFGGVGAVLSAEQAREFARNLVNLADQSDALAEAAKPKPKTRQEFVLDLPVGTVFTTNFLGYGEIQYVRIAHDQVVRLYPGNDGPRDIRSGLFDRTGTDTSDIVINYSPEAK